VDPIPVRGHRFDAYAGQVREHIRDLHNGHGRRWSVQRLRVSMRHADGPPP
jgi:hypothetical protein